MILILITGAGGMIGSHLIDRLSCLVGKDNIMASYYKPTIDMKEIEGKAIFVETDVRYFEDLYSIVERYRPNFIYHLAAQSFPALSWDRPQETLETNVIGTANLFEAIKLIRAKDFYDPTVVVACSSAAYGYVSEQEVPIAESHPLLPLHPYGVSKAAQDLLTYQYWATYGIKGIRARIFNTTGPRKTGDVCSDLTFRAVQIEKGSIPPMLRAGNTKSRRAILDVRDLVSALILLAQRGMPGEAYNISAQKAYGVDEIIEIIEKELNASFDVQIDSTLLRPKDEPIILGDSSKLILATGWRPKHDLAATVRDMLQYWRQKLQAGLDSNKLKPVFAH